MYNPINEDEYLERLRESRVTPLVLREYNERLLGSMLAQSFSSEIRFVSDRRIWYCYDGIRWVPDKAGLEVMKRCKLIVSALYRYALSYDGSDGDKLEFIKTAKRLQSRHSREMMIKDAQDVCPIQFSEFDKNPYLINCINGTYDLESGFLFEHSCDDYITRLADVYYKEGCHDERFDAFMRDITMADAELYMFIKAALGYGISGSSREECLFLLYGATTRNGKSTLLESVAGVLGDYACSALPETVAVKRSSSSGPSEDIARLKGVRFVTIAEPDSSLIFNASRVKTLTGGDTVTARFLHENSFEFRPQFKLYINTNHLPKITDITLFTSKRIRVIPFLRHFEEHEQDKGLKEYFSSLTAKSAIFNFLIEGYKYYKEFGLPQCRAAEEATEEYREASDKIKQFLDERMTEKIGAFVAFSEVYREYRSWCIGKGYSPVAQNKFGEKIKMYAQTGRNRICGTVTRTLRNYDFL